MTPRRDRFFLGHMLAAMERLVQFTERTERVAFNSDWVLQNAVVRELEVLGEAAARLSAEFVKAHPDIPWREITILRHKLMHEYFAIDLSIVWRTATVNVPQILPLIAAARDSLADV